MKPVFSRTQMRQFDQLASEKLRVPSIVLMENAGRGAVDVLLREFGEPSTLRVVVACGAGNNGGDGYVVARRLRLLGAKVEVWSAVAKERLRGDAASNYEAAERSLGAVKALDDATLADFEKSLVSADVVVDALFGTGLERPIEGTLRAIVECLNAAPAKRFALDLPSGLDADTGEVHGIAVRADATVTFAGMKLGLLTPRGAEYSGRVEVADIGVDAALLHESGHSARLATDGSASALLKPRAVATHKANSGRVLVLAGSPGKVGAALLVAEGALRGGAGLVTLAGVPALSDALDRRVLEAMTARLDPDHIEASLDALLAATNVVATGPGLGFDAHAKAIVERVVIGHTGVVVVDADAITHFKDSPERLASARGPRILTPHSGELARLLSCSAADVEANRFAALARAVELTRCIVLLKGPHTLVGAPGELPVVGRRGSPALATGGSGDVLGGVIAALACELAPLDAAWTGAYLHALSAEMWSAATQVDRGLVAHEIAAGIPRARSTLQRTH
ncbi:MAG TPA: NAD(P)H-hydrate dehydratase [Polyangiaceae bacterium]|nr:NAD(P)H-hydrate dehydratase [Polyangiaceae bacterium]